MTGNVTAGGSYRVTGSGVTLGGQDGIVQKASGDVRITALAGDVNAVSGLTLTSDADGAGAEALVLDAAGQIGFAAPGYRRDPVAARRWACARQAGGRFSWDRSRRPGSAASTGVRWRIA